MSVALDHAFHSTTIELSEAKARPVSTRFFESIMCTALDGRSRLSGHGATTKRKCVPKSVRPMVLRRCAVIDALKAPMSVSAKKTAASMLQPRKRR